MTSSPFFSAWFGGVLLGGSASLLLVTQGRVAGISGIVGGLLKPGRGEVAWRLAWLLGMLTGALVLARIAPERVQGAADSSTVSTTMTIVAGLLVGVGTQLGRGCTSGHGVCGISRGSTRSILATLTFMVTGALATSVVHHVLRGRAW